MKDFLRKLVDLHSSFELVALFLLVIGILFFWVRAMLVS